MLEIVLNKISKNYGNKKILKNINFEIKTNEKVALIGQNGCGKTTLFKLITKIENPDSGTITIRKGAKIGLLARSRIKGERRDTNRISYHLSFGYCGIAAVGQRRLATKHHRGHICCGHSCSFDTARGAIPRNVS